MTQSKIRPASTIMLAALILTAVLGFAFNSVTVAESIDPPRPAPEFTQTDASAWINSRPLTLKDLRGEVVLLDFWTFDCWNCYRSFPWLNALEARFQGQSLRVIGVHTPEFAHEKVKTDVVAKIKAFGLHHPVMMDNDFAYWNAVGNRFWPAYYLIDKQGRLRASFVGETHVGDERAKAIETALEYLLAEKR